MNLEKLIRSGIKEIVLDCDIVLDSSRFDNGGIDIFEDDITIDGNGHSIDAQGKGRIFNIFAKNVTLKNIIFLNGFTDDWGGAIWHSGGSLTIINCTFKHNRAKDGGLYETLGYGGAISNNKGNLNVIDSTFKDNVSHCYGAAIHNKHGTLRIEASNFEANSSGYSSAAIYNEKGGDESKPAAVIIENSHFNGNPCKAVISNGGNCEIRSSSFEHAENTIVKNHSQCRIFDCDISNNSCGYPLIVNYQSLHVYGGCFTNNSSSCIITNKSKSNLSIHNAKFIANDPEHYVIYNDGNSCDIEKSVFENGDSINILNRNVLTLNKSKITADAKTIMNDGYVMVKNSPADFLRNIEGEGKVEINEGIQDNFDFTYLDRLIRESETNEIILDENISFENYEADFYEGGIELETDNLIIDGNGNTIDGNGRTRIFHISAKNIILKNLTFKNGATFKSNDNTTNSWGGALAITSNNSVSIENCRFIGNVSDDLAGAIFMNFNGKMDISDTTFKGNSAVHAGAVLAVGSELNVINSSFENNSSKMGGCIFNSSGKVEIFHSSFEGNNANCAGAVLNAGGKLDVRKSSFRNNTGNQHRYARQYITEVMGRGFSEVPPDDEIPWGGGAIQNLAGEANIEESIFEKNIIKCTINGGGAIQNIEGILNVRNSMFKSNTSKGNFGAISNIGQASIINSTFEGNVAQWVGGGAIGNAGIVNIIDSLFRDNSSQRENGGAIKNLGEMNIERSVFENNSVKYKGGAIYNESRGKLSINGADFKNNASTAMGAIYVHKGDLNVENTHFEENSKEKLDEVIIPLDEENFKITDCTFSNGESDDEKQTRHVVLE